MRLRKVLKPYLDRILVPWARFYLRKERHSRYKGVHVQVPPGVFHPGLFLSTRFMMRHLAKQSLAGQRLWEIGAGSGMVSIWCAMQGAKVVASDISARAVKAIRDNAAINGVSIDVVEADLFENMPSVELDWIVINPPYYPSNPVVESDHAFLAGTEYQYFERLFGGIHAFSAPNCNIRMVLSEDCALDRISEIALRNGWKLLEVDRMRKMGEWNFIYSVAKDSIAR